MTTPGNAPDWLTARPIAHRGLHDGGRTRVENSGAAARAAIAQNYAIECDIQLSADGEAMVFHDFGLARLTDGAGDIGAKTVAELAALTLQRCNEAIPTLPQFLQIISARTPLVCEIKSRFDGDLRLAERAAKCLAAYDGPAALKSFDPAPMAFLRDNAARLGIVKTPLGMVGQARYDDPDDEWAHLAPLAKQSLAQFLHYNSTRPDFLSWGVNDLPHSTPNFFRAALLRPVLTWTVRTPAQAQQAAAWADQMIFEGWTP